MPNHQLTFRVTRAATGFVFLAMLVTLSSAIVVAQGDSSSSLTPLQREIQRQQTHLNSTDVEERRDALMRLGALHHPAASRVASSALNDSSIIVRVAAMDAVLSLPKDEAVALLVPSLKDKDEFVRQEAAYALGKSHSRNATAPLLELLSTEKKTGVIAATVVALGRIGDESAVVPLAQLLVPAAASKKKAAKVNEFVLRAAAHSLGEIGNRAAVSTLIAVLNNEQAPADVRREAATALGMIADPDAASALRSTLSAADPLLATAAQQSLKRIELRQRHLP